MMPVLVGFLDGNTGAEILATTLLTLTEAEQDFTFELTPGMGKPPVLSVMRGFSAPVYSEVVGQVSFQWKNPDFLFSRNLISY